MPGSVALVFGAFIIVFFAYDRFNGAGYEGSQQFERLVAYLSPDKLRARRIVLRAYLLYAATLLAIYLFLCTYATVLPLLGAPPSVVETVGASGVGTQEPSGEVAAADGGGGRRISDRVALGVALIMVGLAPSFPILEKFESWVRSTAHRIAGIPTRVIEIAENLRRNQPGFKEEWDWNAVPGDMLLIPAGNWHRMIDYNRAAHGHLSAPEDFRDDLKVIFAVSAWILDRKLGLTGARDRLRFEQLEAALRTRSEALMTALDEKASAPARPSAARKADAAWELLARQADDLADDFCFLLALYLEHEIILPGQPAPAQGTEAEKDGANDKAHVSRYQHRLAKAKLEEFLSLDGVHPAATLAPQSQVVVTWLWTLGIVVVVSLLWSQFPGNFEAEMQNGEYIGASQRALSYMFNSFTSFCVPMIVALALRDYALQARHWHNMATAHWTRAVPQGVVLVLLASATTTIMLIAANFWELSIARSNFNVSREWIDFQFAYVGPTTLRGAILALIVVLLLDAHLARAPSLALPMPWLSSLSWAVVAAVTMAAYGGITRSMTAWVAMSAGGRNGLDDIDRGLIVYAAIYSAVIGFLVVFCVAEHLLNLGTGDRSSATAPEEA